MLRWVGLDVHKPWSRLMICCLPLGDRVDSAEVKDLNCATLDGDGLREPCARRGRIVVEFSGESNLTGVAYILPRAAPDVWQPIA
jgi:hypothetical protein